MSRDGITSASSKGHPRLCFGWFREQHIPPCSRRRIYKLRPQTRPSQPALLATGHGPERQVASTTSQRFAYFLHKQQIRRPSQEETTGNSIFVNEALDGEQHMRHPLHLIKGDLHGPSSKSIWFVLGLLEDAVIV